MKLVMETWKAENDADGYSRVGEPIIAGDENHKPEGREPTDFIIRLIKEMEAKANTPILLKFWLIPDEKGKAMNEIRICEKCGRAMDEQESNCSNCAENDVWTCLSCGEEMIGEITRNQFKEPTCLECLKYAELDAEVVLLHKQGKSLNEIIGIMNKEPADCCDWIIRAIEKYEEEE